MRGGRAILVEANKRLPDWRKAVKQAAIEAMSANFEPLNSPLKLIVNFYLPRPQKPKFAPYPATKPDLDKYVRAIGDALTEAGAISDDGLIVEIHAMKLWAGFDGNPPSPGCSVFVTQK